MIFSSIKSRILSLAIIPVAAASLIFFSYFVNKQNNLIEKALTDKGNDVAQHLAVASEYAIFSGNLSFLSPQVDAALAQSSIVSITIMDDRGIALIQKYNDSFTAELQENSTTSTSNNRIFNRPVIQSSLNISDFDELERTQTAIIGWVIVELSNHLAEQQKRQSTIETLLITLAILISSIYLATRISSRIATPITTLTNAVREIEHGNLEVSVNTHSSGELLSLEQGVKGMLRSIKFSHQDAQQKIKQATLELRESYELLENKNYDLTIARQAALSASQAKSFFLANISHEIRTPMNGILGFVRLLKSSPLSKEQLDHLHTIEQSSHNLLHIINDVLDLSRIEAGKILIKNTRFNLRESIEEVEILMSPSANEKGLEITELFYDDTPEVIIGPQDRIRQVLINLLGNAIKFSDHGTITIRAMIESRNNETTTIKLSVSDQGPGISKKGQELLFNTFTQLDESDTRQHGGAGLGLSISKSLAKAMNGDIGVESQLNEGSTFWFTFECTLPKNPDIFIQEQKAFSGKTAAIYDANNISRQNLSHTFRKIGFFVKEYTSIEELNNRTISDNEIDILILNLTANETINTLSRLKNLSAEVTKKTVAILNILDTKMLKILGKHGIELQLSRPFRRSDLIATLTKIIKPHKTSEKHQDEFPVLPEKPITQHQLDGIRILVAEDNAINAKFINTILKRSGAKTTIVNNGRLAIDRFINDYFDIVLMDIHMPIMDGIEATKKIRGMKNGKQNTPVIGLTAISLTDGNTAYKDAGLNDVLEKPIAVDELLHEIAYWAHTNKPGLSAIDANVSTQKNTVSTNQLGVDNKLSSTLQNMLFEELPVVREKLMQAYSAMDWPALRSEIHRFLGGISYCNVQKLKELTIAFQDRLKSQDDNLDRYFEAMITEIDLLITSHLH